jgi:FAD/FMN-containing dehydrogenase
VTDYGHDLLFGTFATPSARDADTVVALAELTEAVGLDAVSIQDHPYNAGFLDAYTLMTWIAARTSRIKVTANVTNLPLRPPAVLAKMAASIDILSHGRFEMGLGAGGIVDAIKSMGGPDLSAGERIAAASEAMDIMRGIWRGDGQMFKHRGTHYQIPGVRSGPRPPHEIGIWLGAYKPKILGLTGAKADGWLPSLGYLKLEDMANSHRLIDEAAIAAGRDPREIRRLLNISSLSVTPTDQGFLQGPVDQLVDQLIELVLERGFTGFFITGDDPATIEITGKEIAPAVREAVARARRESGVTAAPTAADRARLSARIPTIAYDALPQSLVGGAVEPGDRDYADVRHTYIWSGEPGLVLMPKTAAEVSEAVLYARTQNVPLAIRSGGHGISGRSTNQGGIVIDLRHLNKVSVLDRDRKLIRLEPGARWGEVAEQLAPHGLAMSSGDYGGVGVGGLVTHGGLGYFARKYGLTIDRLRAAEIVLADGRLVRTDAEHEPDLFWAIRGAGGNFGVVTAVELEAYEIGNVIRAVQTFDLAETAPFLENWGRIIEAAPRELTSFLSVFSGRRGPMAQAISVYAGDDVDAASMALTPLMNAGPLVDQQAHIAPYPALVPYQPATHEGSGPVATRSGLVDHVTPEIAERLAAIIRSGEAGMVQLRSMGGAVHDPAPDAMAFSHRRAAFSVLAAARRTAEGLDREWTKLRPLLNGMYLVFESDTHVDRLSEAFPEPTLSRLRQLKTQYDPSNLFNTNFNILPLSDAKVA